MGDPAGIGPEIACKALSGNALPPRCRVFVVGDAEVMRRAARIVGSNLPVHAMQSFDEYDEGGVNVLDMHIIPAGGYTIGAPSAVAGTAAYAYIIKSIELATAGAVHAVVTNPINKQALRMAGVNYPGHTEIFADKTGTTAYSMVFMLDNVAVAHVTTHCSLREAIAMITQERVLTNIRLLHRTLVSIGIPHPRIAVGGLNPHAGEHGLFGDEEQRFIEPAIAQARAEENINAAGPLPPDTVFMRAFRGEFDGVVSMIHDHGFVALKSRDFERGVNITVGLPIIRTSVGHGTAFDLAGTGTASAASLCEAIRLAHLMAVNKYGKASK